MLDKAYIGKTFEPVIADVEKGRLRFFAKAIGETNPIYTDEAAARDAGYDSLPVPPTFLFSLKMDVPNPFENMEKAGVELEKVLHGEQTFTYYAPAVAGDTLTFTSTVVDIFDKKGGKMEFMIEKTLVTNQDGTHVADLYQTLVQRN